MTRYVVRLAVLAAVVLATPGVVLLLGHGLLAAELAALLAAALCWVPTLLALEGLSRARRLQRLRGRDG